MSEQFFIIKVNRDFPVDIYRGDVMYFEKEHNAVLDEKMRALYLSRERNGGHLGNELARENFIYLPVIVEELVGNKAVMDYYNPTHREVRQINPYEMIRECIIESGKEIRHGLMVNTCLNIEDEGKYYLFANLEEDFDVATYDKLVAKMLAEAEEFYQKNKGRIQDVRYCVSGPEDYFQHEIDAEADKLVNELASVYFKLEQRGFKHDYILKMLDNKISSLNPCDLSRMVVDVRYRIFFPEYNNYELKMSPLVRTVYIFFLKHPEGVLQKNMPEYYNGESQGTGPRPTYRFARQSIDHFSKSYVNK